MNRTVASPPAAPTPAGARASRPEARLRAFAPDRASAIALRAALFLAGLAAIGPAGGADFDALGALSEDEFETLVENLGAATHFRPQAPAEPLGVLGADVALELSATEVDRRPFERAGGELELDWLAVPRLHAQKGLPFNLDVGALVAALPETGATIIGVELRLALLEGGVAVPAVSVRGAYSRLQGVTELELDNYALELAVSKGFLMVTPYAGVGAVRTDASAPLAPSLEDASVTQRKAFAGVNLNLGANVGLEVERTGDYTTYSAKVGLRF